MRKEISVKNLIIRERDSIINNYVMTSLFGKLSKFINKEWKNFFKSFFFTLSSAITVKFVI